MLSNCIHTVDSFFKVSNVKIRKLCLRMKASHTEYNYFKEILNITILKLLKQLIAILKLNLN
ncbi:hypothetical protein B0A80_13430 [Flavobacterium tructae]|nr:hypothetical protein B0A80_13430 [Flavobacterium tructae]